MRRALWVAALLAGCSQVEGLDDAVTPLVRVRVRVTGGTDAAHLRVALVWGAQSLPEPFCILPPANEDVAKVVAAGCRDPLGFVPLRVGADVAVDPGGAPATLALIDLPGADVMVGDLTARVAYASLVAYDDRNGDGALDLRCARGRGGERRGCGDGDPAKADVVLGASFVSMSQPDRRLAYREGDFDENAAFYPRSGCPAPPRGFSIVGAGGFPLAAALAATLQGTLPPEDPATCTEASLDDAVVEIPIAPADRLRELACKAGQGGTTRYTDPKDHEPAMDHAQVCTSLPELHGDAGAPASGPVQLVVAGAPDDPCPSLRHYVLRGCRNDPDCDRPEWDYTTSPPDWWPCRAAP